MTEKIKEIVKMRAMMIDPQIYVPSNNLIRKLSPEQMDRLLSISSTRDNVRDFEW